MPNLHKINLDETRREQLYHSKGLDVLVTIFGRERLFLRADVDANLGLLVRREDDFDPLYQPLVSRIANAMTDRLLQNREKGDRWDEEPLDYLLCRLGDEYGEFLAKLTEIRWGPENLLGYAELIAEAGDIANFLAFIVDWVGKDYDRKHPPKPEINVP